MNTQIQSFAAPATVARALTRSCLRAVLGLLVASVFAASPTHAAVTEAWVHRYNNVVGNANDWAVKAVCDPAGDIIVTGGTNDGVTESDILTIKYSGVDGALLWEKRYSGPANSADDVKDLAVDGSGNVVVTGYSYRGVNNADYYTAKYAAADGALLWERRYSGPANKIDIPNAVAVDSSGNVVVTGSTDGAWSATGSYYDDFYTAKYAAAGGALLWEKRYDGPANSHDVALAVAVDGSGNAVVTGLSASGIDGWGNPRHDYFTARYAAADGALLWEKRGPPGWATGVAVDGSGNVVVTGAAFDSTGSNTDYYTARYAAADGALLWEKRYEGPAAPGQGSDMAWKVAVDGSGNVVVTGDSVHAAPNNNVDYYTVKYAAADGAQLWEQRYNGPENGEDRVQAMALDSGGNVVVSGYSLNRSGDSAPGRDYYTAKYATADGALLWEQRYNGPANGVDQAQALAVDGTGNVFVTGSTWIATDNNDFYTAKYASANGALLWEQRYNGPTNKDDTARAVAVDRNGNVVVTGSSWNGTNDDFYTARYAVTNGALIWEHRYNGPANGHDVAQAVAVDRSGNVIVTGSSQSEAPNIVYDSYTAKYAAADGALLWEQRHNDPGIPSLAVDGDGNVFVSRNSYTAKYAAVDGVLLWEHRNTNKIDVRAVAMDGTGNLVVTGRSMKIIDEWPAYDYYTAKFAGADGALVWERGGPPGWTVGVAVDGTGNVVVMGATATLKYASSDGALLWEKATTHNPGEAVAVDASGNVVVIAASGTLKYASSDGALLWENHNNSNSDASVVAVDASGNVVVTGHSGQWPNSDYYTAKYAAADGALLWEKRYDGPVNGNDNASGLALGPNGMIAVTGFSSGDYATVVYRDTPPPVSFAAWAACHGLTAATAAVDADPDSDGLPNSAEYILGGNPTFPGTSESPTATTIDGDTVLTFLRDDASETNDVTLTVEAGSNLLTWPAVFHIGPSTAASSPGVSITENGPAPDTITVTIHQGKATRVFARLKVTIAP